MKKIRMGLVALGVAASVSLTACGTSEEDLAKESCEINKDMKEAIESGDEDKIKDVQKRAEEFAEDNKDAKGDDEEFLKAYEKECGDLEAPEIEIPAP